VAGVLTGESATAPGGGAAVLDTAGVLVRMRMSLLRNAPGGAGMLVFGAVLGLAGAICTLLLGLTPYDEPGRSVDLIATLTLGWLIGWIMGPIAFRGGGQGLRPEYFALLPLPPRRLAGGLLAASFFGLAPAITLIALAATLVFAGRLGFVPFLVAVPATLLQLVVIVLLSKVAIAMLTATLNSRRGQDLGALLMAGVIALCSGGWSLAGIVGEQLATGAPPALSVTLRVLPSGWAAVAVAAAGRSDWALALAGLLGLAVLAVLLLLAWSALLQRNMRRVGSAAPRRARVREAKPGGAGGGAKPRTQVQAPTVQRLLPATPTGAVIGKELLAWRRDPSRTLALIIALLISVLNIGVPAIAWDGMVLLPWVGPGIALIAAMSAVNLYGDDGTAFWLTRMVPGVERADVRGRQLALLLAIGPGVLLLTAALTLLSGESWTWPWVLAALPPLTVGVAGLAVVVAVRFPIQLKDPNKRTSPFDTTDDPNAGGAVMAHAYVMLGLAAIAALPGIAVVLIGSLRQQPALQWVGVLVSVGVAALLYWGGGRVASRMLVERGAELMDLLHIGPEAKVGSGARAGAVAGEGAVKLSRWRRAAPGLLSTLGILCVFPQGVVPILFNLLNVEQEVKVWFLARYMPLGAQVPVALGFIVVGVVVFWWGMSINRGNERLLQGGVE
jgi:ABC-2 type transport system permease protein